jgi:hypothetical protein
MSKKFGVRIIHRCALSTGNTVITNLRCCTSDKSEGTTLKFSPRRIRLVSPFLQATKVVRPRQWKGVWGQRHAPAAFYPWERYDTHCTGGCVGPRADLDRCRKSRPHRDSFPGPSSPWPAAIPTELPGPLPPRRILSFFLCSYLSIIS